MPRNLEIIRNISGKEKQIFFLRVYILTSNSIGNSKILSKTRQQGFNHRQLSPNFAKELRRILFELLFKIEKIEKNRSEIILNLRILSKILEDKNEIIACQILQRIIHIWIHIFSKLVKFHL